MRLTVFDTANSASDHFERVALNASHNEAWLQARLFENPEILPFDELRTGTAKAIPVCRELPLSRTSGTVFLDLLGVTNEGRLLLVECKLWRNPQARREVVAQIIEYAALLRRLSYADLTARLKASLKWSGQNPLFEHYSSNGGTLPEIAFTDAVAANLKSGDFQLIIAGDGIREDMKAISELLRDQGASLALVEFQLWQNSKGNTLLVPFVPFRTEVTRQRIVTDASGIPLELVDEDEASAEDEIDPVRATALSANREFWQRFIDQVEFDHPDQSKPKHGGNNWVRILLPSPARWLTVYRYQQPSDVLGFYLVEEKGSGLLQSLADGQDDIRAETGLDTLRFFAKHSREPGPAFAVDVPWVDFADDAARIAWLCETANTVVNVLRSRLTSMEE